MNGYVSELSVLGDSGSLFDEPMTQYVIPLYQRAYAWEEIQIHQLIDDIADTIGTSEDYYLGSLIVYYKNGRYEVIDGQQRLTTLFLLLNILGIKTNQSLSFSCRTKSKYTLENISNAVDDTKLPLLTDELKDKGLLEGIKIIKREMETLKVSIDEFKQALKHTKMYRIEVPEHTDLNRYFEVMNTRGEQLEQHDILKAELMRHIDRDVDRSKFALIWDACRDMTGYVQMHFSAAVRKALFGYEWSEMPDKATIDNVDINDAKNGLTIRDLMQPQTDIDAGEKEDDTDRVRFDSIIGFPHFLLHTLRVYVREQGITSSEVNLIDDLLDDKKLVSAFKRVLAFGRIKEESIDKNAFAVGFIVTLLRLRMLFDKYIIKREYVNDESDGEWSLKELKVSFSGKNGRAYYAKTKFSQFREWETTYSPRNKRNLMIQSCLRVSFTSPKVMHWLTDLLYWLYKENSKKLLCLEKYLCKAENIARASIHNYLGIQQAWNYGINTPHILFNYLDYLLWKSSNEPADFIFEFRNSVEHWYPRNPSGGTFEQWLPENGVDRFGNLCLVSNSINSKFSNLAPEAKKTTFIDAIRKGSLKLREMADITIPKGYLSSSENWRTEVVVEHEDRMKALIIGDLSKLDLSASD